MSEKKIDDNPCANVFISYSSSDRNRVNGLGLLLESIGHKVFIDHRTILPGRRWQAELQTGLDSSEVLMVYWTRYSANSDWVRRECEHFHLNYPDRPLVPILGDETPLSELLAAWQSTDFAPIVNELLQMQRQMLNRGATKNEIRNAILKRLKEAGIEMDGTHQRKFLPLFGGLGILIIQPSIWERIQSLGTRVANAGNTVVEAVAQLTAVQTGIVAVAGISGFLACPLIFDQVEEQTNTLFDISQLTDRQQTLLGSAGTGPLTITLLWNNVDDLDLSVTDPSGAQISFESRTSETGGELDVDANAGCLDLDNPSGAENIVWSEAAPEGIYLVEVVYFQKCQTGDDAETPYQVFVSVDGVTTVHDGVARIENERIVITEFNR